MAETDMHRLLDEMNEERRRIVEAMETGGFTMDLAQAAAAVQGAIVAAEEEFAARALREQNSPEPRDVGTDGWPLKDRLDPAYCFLRAIEASSVTGRF